MSTHEQAIDALYRHNTLQQTKEQIVKETGLSMYSVTNMLKGIDGISGEVGVNAAAYREFHNKPATGEALNRRVNDHVTALSVEIRAETVLHGKELSVVAKAMGLNIETAKQLKAASMRNPVAFKVFDDMVYKRWAAKVDPDWYNNLMSRVAQ